MPHRADTPIPLLALLAACGAPPPPGPPPPPVLLYEMPADSAATYTRGDTSAVDIDAGGQTLSMDVASAATLQAEFSPSTGEAPGVAVRVRIVDFSARSTNPMGPPQTASGEDVSGVLSFQLDARGRATVTARPEISSDAAQFLAADALAAALFPRLPAGPVTPGTTWVDTVSVDSRREEGSISSTSVVTYTVAGDTLVAERDYLLVRTVGVDRRRIEGDRQGFDLVEDLSGASRGWFLWDLDADLLYEWVQEAELTGSLDVSASPVPLSVRVRSTTTTRLRPEGPPLP